MPSNLKTSIYVNTDELLNWKQQLESINNKSIENLDKLNNVLKKLNSSMAGNIADGFENELSNMILNNKKHHENMRNLEDFLDNVVVTKENE